jgi:hypothetical protein
MTLEISDMKECEVMISFIDWQFVPGRHVGWYHIGREECTVHSTVVMAFALA